MAKIPTSLHAIKTFFLSLQIDLEKSPPTPSQNPACVTEKFYKTQPTGSLQNLKALKDCFSFLFI